MCQRVGVSTSGPVKYSKPIPFYKMAALESSWRSTWLAIHKLEALLSCPLCNRVLCEPSNISVCEHCFCRSCVLSKLCDGGESRCPVCNMPSWVKDVRPNYQLSAIINNLLSLKSLITTPSIVMPSPPPITTECPVTSTSSSTGEKRNTRGETPLHAATLKGDLTSVESLLAAGADPNTQDNAGWTPLHEACSMGNEQLVSLLIQHGAVVNIPGYRNNTPLHDAAETGNTNIMRLLLQHGANPCARNHSGMTPSDTPSLSQSIKHILNNAVQVMPSIELNTPTRSKSVVMVTATGLRNEQKMMLESIVGQLGGTVSDRFTQQVTHVVCSCDENMCCTRTVKCLSAITTGRWLVDYQWILSCGENGGWCAEDEYEVKGLLVAKETVLGAPNKGRLARMIQKSPGLFDGCEVYLKGCFKCPLPSREELISLITLSDGRILAREPKHCGHAPSDVYPYHAHPQSVFSSRHIIIVHSADIHHFIKQDIIHLPVSWILDCITCFKLIDLFT